LKKAIAAAMLAVSGSVASAGFAAASLQPFTASYSVEWRGMGAGTSTLELEQSDGEIWTYRSRNTARGIFKLAFPQAITQMSIFRIREDAVMPIRYRADDGSTSTARDVELEFDWEADRVIGTAEDRKVSVALQPGTQDAMSVQVALMREVAAGRSPERFWLIDKDTLKQYVYTFEGKVRVDTRLGELETLVYRSQREGSKRVTRLWLAPSLGYLPVRAQQLREERVEFTMTLKELDRKG
jgi:hypothetical protein